MGNLTSRNPMLTALLVKLFGLSVTLFVLSFCEG